MFRSSLALSAAIAIALGLMTPAGIAAEQTGSVQPIVKCDRECLYGYLDKYLDALVKKDVSRLPLAQSARFSENNVMLDMGDGLWSTINGKGDYDLRLADTTTGSVGWFGVVYEHGNPAVIALRIKVQQGLITEVESIVNRRNGDGPFPNPQPQMLKKMPILERIEPKNTRRSRERLISLADGYFDTLQQNDGTIFTEFSPDCNRQENGYQTTNQPSSPVPGGEIMALGCEAQFKTGNFRYDDRLRERRYTVVDEERGLVMASAFIDHSGKLQEVVLTDGTVVKTHYHSPHSYVLFELFKIVDGKIRQIEAVFPTVPYHMKSPWYRAQGGHQ
jgi:hypothetical protein